MSAPFALGGRAIICNPYCEQAANLSQDDSFTLAGITTAGRGLGKARPRAVCQLQPAF